MKKTLGILGTITIAGSGMSGIVGNAPAPTENEINYLQTNRVKRSTVIHSKENDININSRTIDQVQNVYCFLCHNRLILQIDKIDLEDIFFFNDIHPNDRDALFNKIFRMINEFKKENHSGDSEANDYISNDDISIITNVMYD